MQPVISFKGQNFLSFTMDSFNVHGAATFHQANAAAVQAWQSTRAAINQRFHQSKQQQAATSPSTAAISELASYGHAAITSKQRQQQTSKQYSMVLLAKMVDNPNGKSGS
ncbi:hypothetical protein ACLOJK_024061 [Asimina triloba]